MKYVLRIAANISSQHFSLACTYFEGVTGIFSFPVKVVSSCEIVFRKHKCFPSRFWSKRNRNLTFSRCYINNFTRRYVRSINIIIQDSWKRWRRLVQFSFFKFMITVYIIITVWSLLLNSLAALSVLLSVRRFHNNVSYGSLKSSHSLSIVVLL